MTLTERFTGIAVVPSSAFPPPRPPTADEYARRLVRHGLADVLDWLGEPVGPRPGELVHTFVRAENRVLCHPDSAALLNGASRG